MEVKVYYPKDEKNREILCSKLAKVYGDSVKIQINELKCNKRQKLELLDQIIKKKKKEMKR
jgi:hypothetical protein